MNVSIQDLCGRMAAGRDVIKTAFRWENSHFYPVCANLFCARDEQPEAEKLAACRDLIRQETGILSSFRGNVRLPLICLLSLDEDPRGRLDRTLKAWQMLKRRFFQSDYLALAACFLSDLEETELEHTADRARELYEAMKKNHPFLTGSEDSVFCVLLARSERSDEDLIDDMEQSYRCLKETFRDSNSVQTVSHILASSPAPACEKADRLADLYRNVTMRGVKYGKNRELPVLASLSLTEADTDTLADQILQASDYLSDLKGWRGIFGYDRRTRSMHAAMLTADLYAPWPETEKAALSGALAAVLAQQMAACIAATSAAAASSSSSSH